MAKSKLKLIDFWAPWCGPCKMMAPILEELKTELKDKVEIEEVNVDEDPQRSQGMGVMSIPTYIVMDGDREIGRQVGATGKGELLKLLNVS